MPQTVDPEQQEQDEYKRISHLYFYIGFAFLPWLWLINVIYVYPKVYQHPEWDASIRRGSFYS